MPPCPPLVSSGSGGYSLTIDEPKGLILQDTAEATDLYINEAAAIVAAYVSRNAVSPGALPELISSVHTALTELRETDIEAEPQDQKLVPAGPIRKSITPDYLISLEDGKRYKSLKRTLQVRYGLSPDQYREKWGLPSDYPKVAPNYSKKRSELAIGSGLGRTRAPEPKTSRRKRA